MSYALLGKDDAGNKIEVFVDDRLYHTYVVGSTGYGKTQLMTHLVLEDAKQLNPKQGLLVLDPLGGLVDSILNFLPATRLDDVILLQMDSAYPAWGMNLYECSDINNIGEVHRTIERVMRVWNKIFSISRDTPLLSTLMRNLSYLIIFNPPLTMVEIPRLLHEKTYRQSLVKNIKYEPARLYWERFDNLRGPQYIEQVDVVMRRFDEFVAPVVEQIVGQYKSTIDFRKIMDEGKIVLVKMNPEYPGASELIGSIIISLLLMSAYSRRDVPRNKRKQFNLYVDEFQNYATKEFQTIYSEARQFGIGCLVSHQHRAQISDEMRDLAESLLQASTVVCLQTTPPTAKEMAAKFDNTPPEPPMEETGRRKKQVPVVDVVGHLLRVEHRVSLVNRFSSSILQPLKLQSEDREEEENYKDMDGEENSRTGYGTARKKLSVLNEFLYQCMTREQPDMSLIAKALVIIEQPEYEKPYYLAAFEDGFQAYWETGAQEPFFSQVRKFKREYLYRIINAEIDKINELFAKELNHFWNRSSTAHLVPQTPEGYRPYISIVKHQYDAMKKPSWITIDVSKMRVEIISREHILDLQYKITTTRYALIISPGQERKCYREEDIAREIERIMPLDYPDFQDAISDLKTIQQALRQYPILADGGEEEVVLRPGQRLTPDQIRDSITNELIHLETGRARVRLKQPPPNLQSLVCHRCGKVHSITGTAKEYNGPIRYSPSTCSGCKIPLRTEYLIEIQRPQGNYAPLEPRVKRIVANNRRQGYLRIRDDIQKDIDDRQQASTLLHPAPEPISKTPTTQPSSPPPIKRQNKIV